ncbi:hypothetical protein NDU88_001250 [Pleurodeles waltl]|uniref:Uncharacterized protein n=1 Tax=Pleurodeles waltl TaxID=8319 RepID=A0AAV7NDP0_PLEWA|nr:hypothetical protein NDU88_001250 [Pleurodeles waltl]
MYSICCLPIFATDVKNKAKVEFPDHGISEKALQEILDLQKKELMQPWAQRKIWASEVSLRMNSLEESSNNHHCLASPVRHGRENLANTPLRRS